MLSHLKVSEADRAEIRRAGPGVPRTHARAQTTLPGGDDGPASCGQARSAAPEKRAADARDQFEAHPCPMSGGARQGSAAPSRAPSGRGNRATVVNNKRVGSQRATGDKGKDSGRNSGAGKRRRRAERRPGGFQRAASGRQAATRPSGTPASGLWRNAVSRRGNIMIDQTRNPVDPFAGKTSSCDLFKFLKVA